MSGHIAPTRSTSQQPQNIPEKSQSEKILIEMQKQNALFKDSKK